MADAALTRLDTLLQVGLRIARAAPTGRIVLARVHAAIDPEWIPRPWGDGIIEELSAAFPAVSAKELMQEVRERVLDELDLEHEATIQRRFHRALRSHPFLLVPAPVTRLAHEQVLVSEWIDGVPLWQAPDPDEAAARLLAFVLGAGSAGLAHADPLPDDVLVTNDGRLAILDFGATRAVDPARSQMAAAAVDALAAQDDEAFGDALDSLGVLPPEHGGTALELARNALGELAGPEPSRLDSAAVIAARDRLFQRPAQIAELILAGSVDPQDLWPLRGHAQLFATIARVGATGCWRELALAALHDGWQR
jgi:hypothetical protein